MFGSRTRMDSRNAENDIVGPIGSGRLDPFLRSWQEMESWQWSHISSRWGWRNWCEVSHAVGSCPQTYRRAGERCSCGILWSAVALWEIWIYKEDPVLPRTSRKILEIHQRCCLYCAAVMLATDQKHDFCIYIYIYVVWRYCSWGSAWSIRSSLATTQTWWPEMQLNCTDQGHFLPWRTITI